MSRRTPKIFWEEPDALLIMTGLALIWLVGRPLVSYAADVVVGARTAAGDAIERAAAAAFASRGYEALVTSAREGAHMAGSAHPIGNARDFRTQHVATLGEKYEIRDAMRQALGPAFDVIVEWDPEHLHAELDPVRGANWS